jgi:8-oxo-dGTP diphosphatase
MSDKTLVLIRHAHRDTTRREADNGLSDKGRKQAAALAKHFARMFPEETSPKILSSPKLRCVETVTPIARLGDGRKIQASQALLERGARESQAAFEKRIRGFLEWWKTEGPAVTVACSHGDWLPEALRLLTGANVEFRKGAWVELGLSGGTSTIRWVIQRF